MNRGFSGMGGVGRKRRTTYGSASSNAAVTVSAGSPNATLVSLQLVNAEPGAYMVLARTFCITPNYYDMHYGRIYLVVAGTTRVTSDPRNNGGERTLFYLHTHTGGNLSIGLGASYESYTTTYGSAGDDRFGHRIAAFRVGDY